ncbi:MAG: carbonic anhydrase [Patescibacteria group bacterium]
MNRNDIVQRRLWVIFYFCLAFLRLFRKKLSGFATAFECMDGRVHGASRKWAKRNWLVAHVDIITQKGMVRVLAENSNVPILENIKDMLWTSIKDHGSRRIIIAAHQKCAGNPISDQEQIAQLYQAKETLGAMIASFPLSSLGIKPSDIEVALLWVNKKWMPERVCLPQKHAVAA